MAKFKIRMGNSTCRFVSSIGNLTSLQLMIVIAICAVCCLGCTPRTLVKKNPGPHDCGVRYYRPKPYLMVKPAVDRNGAPVPGFVSIETTMLPDFAEEYSIHVRSGLGNNKTSITLEDGWNLTRLNVEVDSQTDENLRATAEILKGIPTGGIAGTLGADHRIEVRGTNVPLGLYESVIATDGCQKQLHGFRYVGFLPFSGSSVDGVGGNDLFYGDTSLYGLIFDREANVMVFKLLHEISDNRSPEREVIMTSSPQGIKQDADSLLEDNSAESLPID